MAGSGTKGDCTGNLNNMKNKAPAEMCVSQRKKERKKIYKKKGKTKKRKKGSYFQQQGLEVFLETNSWLHLFANSTTSCSILESVVFDELLGLPVASLDVYACENKNIHNADPKACSCT